MVQNTTKKKKKKKKKKEMFNSTRAAWKYFITKVKALCETFSTVELPLAVTDLIFSKSTGLKLAALGIH